MKATIPLACQGLSQCNVLYIAGVSTFAIDTLGFAAAALTLVTGWDYLTTGLHHASQAQRASAPVRE